MSSVWSRYALVAAALACIQLPAETSNNQLVRSVEIRGSKIPFELRTHAGETLDMAKVQADVKRLWASGRFADIRVESLPDALIFRVVEKNRLELRKLDVDPPEPGLQLPNQQKTLVDELWVREVAVNVRNQLGIRGYRDAQVKGELLPVGKHEADVKLTVNKGEHYKVEGVTLNGEFGLKTAELRKALKSTSARRILPGIPGIWSGWLLLPGFSDQGVQSDLAGLRSVYNKRGYFDASVRLDGVDVHDGKARIRLNVDSGPRHLIRDLSIHGGEGISSLPPGPNGSFPVKTVCKTLLDQRRKADRAGVMDFSARVEIQDLPASGKDHEEHWTNASIFIERGPAYNVGRIEFRGNRTLSDVTLRRSVLVDEGQPLDQMLLRKTLARLNRTGLIEPLTESSVLIDTPPGSSVADVIIPITERKARHWNLSGPVGPMSVSGPLQFSIGSRLPAWGRGILELSTYTASLRFMALAQPLARVFSFLPKRNYLTLVTIQRPLLPGQRLFSGLNISPQLGWKGMLAGYGQAQVQGLLSPLFESNRSFTPELKVSVTHVGAGRVEPPNESILYCEVPKAKLDWVRQIGGISLNLLLSVNPY